MLVFIDSEYSLSPDVSLQDRRGTDISSKFRHDYSVEATIRRRKTVQGGLHRNMK